MKKNHLVKYLLISPSLPVGGFCYSEGLESYLKIKNLEEPEHIRDLITNELNIDYAQCFYCEIDLSTVEKNNDHLIPSCNTTYKIYGHNNCLNKVPSCSNCNGSKGGKVDNQLKKWLKSRCNWDDIKITKLFEWIMKNKEYLYLNDDLVKIIENGHETINLIHKTWEKCANNKNLSVKLETVNAILSTLSDDEKMLVVL